MVNRSSVKMRRSQPLGVGVAAGVAVAVAVAVARGVEDEVLVG